MLYRQFFTPCGRIAGRDACIPLNHHRDWKERDKRMGADEA